MPLTCAADGVAARVRHVDHVVHLGESNAAIAERAVEHVPDLPNEQDAISVVVHGPTVDRASRRRHWPEVQAIRRHRPVAGPGGLGRPSRAGSAGNGGTPGPHSRRSRVVLGHVYARLCKASGFRRVRRSHFETGHMDLLPRSSSTRVDHAAWTNHAWDCLRRWSRSAAPFKVPRVTAAVTTPDRPPPGLAPRAASPRGGQGCSDRFTQRTDPGDGPPSLETLCLCRMESERSGGDRIEAVPGRRGVSSPKAPRSLDALPRSRSDLDSSAIVSARRDLQTSQPWAMTWPSRGRT